MNFDWLRKKLPESRASGREKEEVLFNAVKAGELAMKKRRDELLRLTIKLRVEGDKNDR